LELHHDHLLFSASKNLKILETKMLAFALFVFFCFNTSLFAHKQVGIHTTDPNFVLDVRGTDDDFSEGDLQLATPSANHFLRIFGGRNNDPKPFLLFANSDTFRIASSLPDYGSFTELITVEPFGKVGVGLMDPSQKLDVAGKIKLGDDANEAQRGTMRFNDAEASFEGYDGVGWTRMDNKLVYQNKRLGVNFADVLRNFEQAWGETITIQESGTYLLHVSAYFWSSINEVYASGSSIRYDNRGRLKIYINGLDYKLLECGNGIIDRDFGQTYVSFAPGTRSFTEVISFNAGDEISLTRNMQAVPANVPSLVIEDQWVAQMDAFYIIKLD
jgi:hypothetical protein